MKISRTVALLLVLLYTPGHPSAQGVEQKAKSGPKRPALTLKASVTTGMVPVRVQVSAELRGGDDDFAEYYCPTVEWSWGDGTLSESSGDCEPYEAGKSEIQRRYSISHVYKQAGRMSIQLRLKQKDRVVGSATTVIQVVGGGF